MIRIGPALIVLSSLVGCSDADYIVVTIDKQPAVFDAKSVRVKLTNAGSERVEDLELGASTFPATFSISPSGRTGDIVIDVSALDAGGLLVGHGAATANANVATAKVLLDTADFVVNTELADDQQLSKYFSEHGFQLASTMDGNWTAVHRVRCNTPCNVFGRRFDSTGHPVSTQVAAGTNSFPISTRLTSFWSTPTVGASGTTTLALWNQDNGAGVTTPPDPQYSIDCRAFGATGGPLSTQQSLVTDELANPASIAPLSTGNFAIVWDGRVPTQTPIVIRSAIVKPDCTLLANTQVTLSTITGTGNPGISHVAASGANILYVWTLDGNVQRKVTSLTNGTLQADKQLITKSATERAEAVRVAPLPGGNFAIFVRWAMSTGETGPGRIDMYKVSSAGDVMGSPTLITMRSGTDFASSESFGVAAHTDGSVFVIWHACLTNGDDSGCGVFGRLVSATGMPGTEFQVNTTSKDDQTGPSVVALPGTPVTFAAAWTDKSQTAPDTAGLAVRARILYPQSGLSGN